MSVMVGVDMGKRLIPRMSKELETEIEGVIGENGGSEGKIRRRCWKWRMWRKWKPQDGNALEMEGIRREHPLCQETETGLM
jgi:hypothetical protein